MTNAEDWIRFGSERLSFRGWPSFDWERHGPIWDIAGELSCDIDGAMGALEMAGLWPSPVVDRWFCWQDIDECYYCGGRGYCPDGPCPMHSETIVHGPQRSPRPNTYDTVAWVAGFADRVTEVERHAIQLLDAAESWIDWRGARRIVWWLGHCEQDAAHSHPAPAGLSAAFTALDVPSHLDCDTWAHSCARVYASRVGADAVASGGLLAGRRYADLPDLFGAARAIVDLGVRILALDEGGVLLRPAAFSLVRYDGL